MTKYTFDCGCEIDIVDENIKKSDGLPSLDIDFYNINLECPKTWALFQSGETKGIFQLENNLGQDWSCRVHPQELEDVAALVSIIRPGCLNSYLDGKQLTAHYADRKNNREEVVYFHAALEPILKDTYGILVFQEQSMRIATDIAGFNLQQADILRKAIGKKKPEVMAQVKGDFLKGCQETGIVTNQEAEEIFGWIQESQKYLFNKSHGVGYGLLGYWSAYVKAHFPFHFYTSWLYYANEKMKPQQEIQELVLDAIDRKIPIYPPSLARIFNGDIGRFSLDNNKIYFGLSDIKGIGESHIIKMIDKIQTVEKKIGKTIKDWSWGEFLIHMSDKLSKTVINGVIAAGALDYMSVSRSKMLFEYSIVRQLSPKEKETVQKYSIDELDNTLYKLLSDTTIRKITKPRQEKIRGLIAQLNDPPYPIEDFPNTIVSHETKLLGISLTHSRLDSCEDTFKANTTCKEFIDGKDDEYMCVAVEIMNVREYLIRNGPNQGDKMVFMTVHDDTGSIKNVVGFSNIYKKYSNQLYTGNTVLLMGGRSKKKDSTSFTIKKVKSI